MKNLIPLLLGTLAFLFFFPHDTVNSDLEEVRVIPGDGYIVLVGSSGSLQIPVSSQALPSTYSSSNPYDFFSSLVDPVRVQRVEILPYAGGRVCSAVLSGDSVSAEVEFCLALALRKDVPVFVHRSLLEEQRAPVEGF